MMRFAIVAGGEGARLKAEGAACPKPLVRLYDEPLISRLIRIFALAGAQELVVLLRPEAEDVKQVIRQVACQYGPSLQIVEAATPSSMHSLYALKPYLQGDPFCLTTVDTVFEEQRFVRFVSEAQHALTKQEADGCMGVTTYIDDESPLYVQTDTDGLITAFEDTSKTASYVSAGVYVLQAEALDVLQQCVERGESRLRNFQRALLHHGYKLQACDLGKVADIDHISDIAVAESILKH